ncbi:MAG: hypothetical protein WHT47_06240 [Hydrogenothermaceae bacterium]
MDIAVKTGGKKVSKQRKSIPAYLVYEIIDGKKISLKINYFPKYTVITAY